MTIPALVLLLACTVGEGHPDGPAPAPAGDAPGAVEGGEGPGEREGAEGDVEYRASDLLMRAQQAYEAAEVDEAYELARQVLTETPGTGSEVAARWIAARAAFATGRYAEAGELAGEYARSQPDGAPLALEAVELVTLAEDALEDPAPAVVGAVLPRTGQRVLVRYADWLLEGIELAVAEAERQQGRRIELVVADDGSGTRTREALDELERRGAVAVVGPLLPQTLAEAAGARSNRRLVMVSPTAAETPRWPETYSINSGDTRGAEELGRYAADLGYGQAAVLYARNGEHERKAWAFSREFERLGGAVRTRIPYDSGTTTFGTHMRDILAAVAPREPFAADSLVAGRVTGDTLGRPVGDPRSGSGVEPGDSGLVAGYDTLGGGQEPFALFVAAPPQDVRQIAPQVSFYGLDSAGVQVFGDEAWASAPVRRVVSARDLEGVLAASHFPPDRSGGAADPGFVEAYEAMYRRSLENAFPALGYDAANLVLQALPNRALRPEALARRFELLAGIRGATGLLSVRGGQVVRTPYLVEIQKGQLAPAPFPWEYEMPEPKPPLPESNESGGQRR